MPEALFHAKKKESEVVKEETKPLEVIQSDITNKEVSAFFDLWNNALGNLPIVTAQYAKDAVLLPSVSHKPHTNYDGIKE